MKTAACIVFGGIMSFASAHMEMNWPYPIKSKFDPANDDSQRDYNMIAPLSADGSNFPCKGYNNLPNLRTVATYKAGLTYNMSIVGGAPHNGGSCQLSLSFDGGKSFKVIKSMIGGCPLTQSYDFTIPVSSQSGKALLAWTWFNLVGNREMYMDCASVSVEGAPVAARSLEDFPDMFTANIGTKSSCRTVENEQLVFPNPGSDVVYGAGFSSSSPKSNICKDGSAPPASSASSPSLSPTVSSSSPTMSVNNQASSTVQRSTAVPTTFQTAIRSISSASPATSAPVKSSSPEAGEKCQVGSTRCDSSSSWSVCSADGSSYIFMGSVAPGTVCAAGKLVRDPTFGDCTGVPTIKCAEGGKAFMVCDQGNWVDMASVAPGTACRDGSIVAA